MLSYTNSADPRPSIYLPDALASTVPAVATAITTWRNSPTAANAKAADDVISANRAALFTAATSQLATARTDMVDAEAAIQPAREKVAELAQAVRALEA